MSEKITYWLSIVFSSLAFVLFLGNTMVMKGNVSLQEEVSKRQNIITTGTNLVQLNKNLAESLAQVSIEKDDEAIRELLASQGITLRSKTNDDAAKKK